MDAVIDRLGADEGIKLGSYIRVEKVMQDEKEIPERTLNGVTYPAHTAPAKEVVKIKKTSAVNK